MSKILPLYRYFFVFLFRKWLSLSVLEFHRSFFAVFLSSIMICTISSDVLAYVCTFLPSDENVIRLFISCKRIKVSQFLTKVNLKKTYRQSDCDQYKTLSELRKRIRCWTVANVVEDLPPCLYALRFGLFNQNIDNVMFPVTLQRLKFGWNFNQKVDNAKFPSGLKQLKFNTLFDQNIDNVKFPSNLQHLIFGVCFNRCIDNVKFPSSLQKLIFGAQFDQNIDNVMFPVGLKRLEFGWSFNQNIDNVKFPTCLQHLTFDGCFNQKIDKVQFPSSLQQLTFGEWFNKSIDNVNFPPSLIQLTFSQRFSFSFSFNQSIIKNVKFPPFLKEITFRYLSGATTTYKLQIEPSAN
jgi:hypothetical protein